MFVLKTRPTGQSSYVSGYIDDDDDGRHGFFFDAEADDIGNVSFCTLAILVAI